MTENETRQMTVIVGREPTEAERQTATLVVEFDHTHGPVFSDAVVTISAEQGGQITEDHTTIPLWGAREISSLEDLAEVQFISEFVTQIPGVILPAHVTLVGSEA